MTTAKRIYVCEGGQWAAVDLAGSAALVQTPEPSGDACRYGGVKVENGGSVLFMCEGSIGAVARVTFAKHVHFVSKRTSSLHNTRNI